MPQENPEESEENSKEGLKDGDAGMRGWQMKIYMKIEKKHDHDHSMIQI